MSSSNRTEILVGAGVVACAAGFLIYAAQAIGLGATPAQYELQASFRAIDGIRVGTDVRLGGVKIGSVTGTELDPATFQARTRFTVRNDILLPDDSTVLISSEGLLGGNFVEIMPGGSLDNLAPGAEIEDTQGSVSLTGLLMKFVAGGSDEKDDKGGEAFE